MLSLIHETLRFYRKVFNPKQAYTIALKIIPIFNALFDDLGAGQLTASSSTSVTHGALDKRIVCALPKIPCLSREVLVNVAVGEVLAGSLHPSDIWE